MALVGAVVADDPTGIVAAIEARRLAEGLSHHAIAEALGIAESTYRRLRAPERAPLSLKTCRHAANWLEIEYSAVLRWEGYWDRLAPLGKVLLPALLKADLRHDELAKQAGVAKGTVGRALWAMGYPPRKQTLAKWAATLNLDMSVLLRARNEHREMRPRQPRGIVGRILHREGRQKLREINARRLRRYSMRSRPVGVREAMQAQRTTGIRLYHDTKSEREAKRWRARHLDPLPKGEFGFCRGCRTLTYRPADHLAKGSREERGTGEWHIVCLGRWRKQSSEWSDWVSAKEIARRRDQPFSTPQPEPSYGPGRRPSADELADYYRTAVLYLRASVIGTPAIADLATQLGLTERGLRARVERLTKWLPDPALCNRGLKPKVLALQDLRALKT
jgi:transcriptional regulator with XRE-family HTH domain